jgi:hypothetical protein
MQAIMKGKTVQEEVPDSTTMNRGLFVLMHLYSLGVPDSTISLYALTNNYKKREICVNTWKKYIEALARNEIAEGQSYENGDMDVKIDREKLRELIQSMKDSTSCPSQ